MIYCQPSKSRRGPGRECCGGSVTVISIRLCVFCQPSGSRRGQGGMLGWECNCHLYTALCFILLAKWKQEGAGRDMLGLECDCY